MLSNPFHIFGKLRLSHKGILLVCVPLIFGLIFVSVLIFMEIEVEAVATREARTKDMYYHISQLQLKIDQLAKCMGLYVITKNDIWRQRLLIANEKLPKEVAALRSSVSGSPKPMETFNALQLQLNELTNLVTRFQASMSSEGPGLAVHGSQWDREFLLVIGKLESLARDMQLEAERSSQAEATNSLYSRPNVIRILIIGVAFNVVITILLALYFSKDIASRVAIIVDNANRMISGKELNPLQAGNDEIAQLDRVFHTTSSALIEAARKERAIFDNAVDVICKVDQSGMLADVNRAAQAVWSYSPQELIGKKLIDLIAEPIRECVYKKLLQIKSSEEPNIFEASIVAKGGTLVDMLWSVHWSNSERSYFCVAHDVSERKRIEQLKQDFMNMVSHDLRTPMLSFQLFLDLLTTGKGGDLEPRTLNMAQQLRGAMRTLNNLINDLLDLEKMESGKLALKVSDIPVAQVVEEAEDALKAAADFKELTIVRSGSDAAAIRADRDRICQVLINLLSNAIKYSPPKSTIRITWSLEGESLSVRVKDEGPGIAPEFKETVFERFRQIEGPTRVEAGGSGLGLAICKQLINLHGGEIGVESNGQNGAEFWFTLPTGIALKEAPVS